MNTTMTRAEHLAWCKQRAMVEYDYYIAHENHDVAARNAVMSMVSDCRKHPDTDSHGAGPMAAFAMLNIQTLRSRADVQRFIDGYN